ncbi:hybrid sensor histidine kinase/response regulator [Acinetobacter gerneri]|uniref:Chemotaxis protein CheA n=1 Tax=Acinetobacter gerneri DSM 14967 = CIP 107464 = MTCC 9824 TaxID=1120926 RepID=N8YDJ5_9GAMM|nr:Hpt domain-containing protein [Acinetobacter gerneri]ENV34877.1 hypothetical protein F960_00848 [Acinetobacter gerneri DSM 14967 = CIP 107464 = MTCC 9824]EPR81544.1 Signal transduction histidine kinase CheA [Acinetobacter gerneri DSM 14967 = CIP 107464 = MTCC 9824]
MKEKIKQLIESIALVEDCYCQEDVEILDIFTDELQEILIDLESLLTAWQATKTDQTILKNIRRYFHTLKGSGRMIGAKSSAELAWTVEDLLNRVISKKIQLNDGIMEYVSVVFRLYLNCLVHDFKSKIEHQCDFRPFMYLGMQLQKGESLNDYHQALLDYFKDLDVENLYSKTKLEFAQDIYSVVEKNVSNQNHDLLEIDLETLSIFIEESQEHLSTIQHFIALAQPESDDFNQLLRAVHTLRGSSAMAQVEHIFIVSSFVEDVLKSLIQEETIDISNKRAWLAHYHDFVVLYLAAVQSEKNIEYLNEIYQIYELESKQFDLAELSQSESTPQLIHDILHLKIDELLDAEYQFVERIQHDSQNYLAILIHQCDVLIEKSQHKATQALVDCAEALKSAYRIFIQLEEIKNNPLTIAFFAQAHQVLIQLFDHLAAGQRLLLTPENTAKLTQLNHYLTQIQAENDAENESRSLNQLDENSIIQTHEDSVLSVIYEQISLDKLLYDSSEIYTQFDPDLLNIFTEEADELLIQIDLALSQWSDDITDVDILSKLMRYLHTLKGGANMAQAAYLGLVAHHLESIYEKIIHHQIEANHSLVTVMRLIQDDVADRVAILKTDRIDYPVANLLNYLKNIGQLHVVSKLEREHLDVAATDLQSRSENNVDLELVFTEISTSNIEQANDVIDDTSLEEIAHQAYVEEASELITRALTLLKSWSEAREKRSLLLELQRISHTLKGGARIVGLTSVAEISYALEISFEKFAQHHFNSNIYDALLEKSFKALYHSIINAQFDEILILTQSLKQLDFENISLKLPTNVALNDDDVLQTHFEIVQGDGTEPPAMSGELQSTNVFEQQHEMVKISAGLVEKMIDLSGENSINRSRIELDLTQLNSTLNEMELTIHRLADQLRRMEGELETQIIAKHDDGSLLNSDFDPLEMDQYSSLNQLSKSLAESASDLVDFKMTLAEKIRDTESLLLQQSRIQAEMQEGLMRARLVPFSRVVPRLQRLVRQISTSLNRPTELQFSNVQGEFDRNILEKLITPFEHMLRNAIDHGIEDTNQRLSANKSPTGSIQLDVERLGGEIIVTFADDGRGIDVESIRQKAIEKGLIHTNQSIDDQEILQFIFNSGLSTAKQVTQISGRGVGLDVVQSEIKSLGGQISVVSELGKGTTFTIRVPISVAVSDALMVKIADQQYAIPLAQIDRIIRISPMQLDEYFNSHDDYFEIDFQSYKLRYLSEFLGNQTHPKLKGIGHSLPVLLVKNNLGQTVAILVDQIIGSRSQIVVKPIGQQFSQIGVISGATILGDGQVCLILDSQNIARQIQSTQRIKQIHTETLVEHKSHQRKVIMIVDDSVTVRKVASRLLERQGYEVLTAKDGLDAVEQLENIRPDLMLLDIEMPRMDGFELTQHVRHHAIHAQLPIIMITSRTGEKHREKAFALGVTRYMGKPFQEKILLQEIESLLTKKIVNEG